MENMQKALMMAGSVFMFVIAISVAIFSYNTVQEVNNSILTASENNSRDAEYFIATTEDVERYANRAEIITAILSMADTDYAPDEIIVTGVSKVFKKSDFLTVSDKNRLENVISQIKEGSYSISYQFTNYELNNPGKVVVTYSLVSI